MFNNSTPLTMPVVPAGYTNGNNSGAWGDGGWLWIIVVFALLFGWGNNGFGGNGFNGGNAVMGTSPWATQADVRAAVDQQTLISKIDQQTYGIADSFTALNNTLNNNFRGIDNAICTFGYQTQQGFNDTNMAMMQNTNAIQSTLNNMAAQNAACCCETQRQIERGFADTNYNMATQANAIQNAMCNNTRDIIENANANSRAVLDFLVNDKLSTLQTENQNLKLAASQAEQNQYLVAQLRPTAVPAYITCSPYQSAYGIGINNGCGCC